MIRAGLVAIPLVIGAGVTRAGLEPSTAGAAVRPAQGTVRDADIRFYEQRVARDPAGALDRLRLGTLRLDRARATGDERDLIAAESLARTSLALRAAHNSAAWHLLSASLLGQHRFLAALAAADSLLARRPDSSGARALRGEILLELGRYETADSIFAGLSALRFAPSITPRYARWHELRGRSSQARALLESGFVSARERESSSEQAWYALRLSELYLRHGRPGRARRYLDQGLALVPGDSRMLAIKARVALAAGKPREAIVLADSSLAERLDPATLAIAGDAWRAAGRPDQAEPYWRALAAAAGTAPPGGFHRAWYLALLDHDLHTALVLGRVVQDLTVRRDIHGWDLLAWALYRNGRPDEARAAMRLALSFGTDDPDILRHAREIGMDP